MAVSQTIDVDAGNVDASQASSASLARTSVLSGFPFRRGGNRQRGAGTVTRGWGLSWRSDARAQLPLLSVVARIVGPRP